jgi:hypothetical protein
MIAGLLVEWRPVVDPVVGPAGVLGVVCSGKAPPRARHLADIELLPESGQELVGGPVSFVKRQPVEMHPVGHGPVELRKGDLPLRPVVDLLGNACLLAAFAVLVPALGQEQVDIDEGPVPFGGNRQVDGDDAVLFLAELAAILTLDAGGLSPFLV